MTISINDVDKETAAFYIEAGWVDEDGNLIGCCGRPVGIDGRCPACKENCL